MAGRRADLQERIGFVNASTRHDIAGRLRELITAQDHGDLPALARRLGVEEVSLRMSLDDLSPFPTVDVMIAFVGAYGVDAKWLLTGTYDPAIHRRVLEAEPDAVGEVIRGIATDLATKPTVSEPVEAPRLHIA
jgi:hypothetical protein